MMRPYRIAAGVLLPVMVAAPFWGPPLLARTPLFPVERVEVAGARIVAPHDILTASGIRGDESVWTNPDLWEARLRVHPGIEGASVTRRLPGTLRIQLREKTPVGFVEAGVLRPVTVSGEILAADAARIPMDLPLIRVAAPDGRVRSARDLALLAETARIGQIDPYLLVRISEIRWSGDDILLSLSSPYARVLLPASAGATDLGRLRAAIEEVEGRLPPPQNADEPVHLDLRYHDQVVVRLPSRA
ncbi:MAG: FtsQ-type POTRA domain-containing protein [Gemmatimonadota bacterium]|nr:FtsQ-type POTRA domain-containing protein [Gemmatimonadota bacterium]